MKDWTLIRQIPTNGPGFFLRSHENSDYAWVDGMNGPHPRHAAGDRQAHASKW